MTKSEEAKRLAAEQLRYKKPALMDMDYGLMIDKLTEIQDDCIDIHDMVEDDEILLAALDGDEEEAFEFKLAFSDIEGDCEKLIDAISEHSRYRDPDEVEQEYNDCTVTLVGDIYDIVGYDSYEEDYYQLTSYVREYAQEEAGKRLMRKTKAEMLNIIGFNMRLFLGYYELKQRYEHLKATIEIVKGSNQTLIDQLREIDKAYERANNASLGFRLSCDEERALDRLLERIPEKFWVE